MRRLLAVLCLLGAGFVVVPTAQAGEDGPPADPPPDEPTSDEPTPDLLLKAKKLKGTSLRLKFSATIVNPGPGRHPNEGLNGPGAYWVDVFSVDPLIRLKASGAKCVRDRQAHAPGSLYTCTLAKRRALAQGASLTMTVSFTRRYPRFPAKVDLALHAANKFGFGATPETVRSFQRNDDRTLKWKGTPRP